MLARLAFFKTVAFSQTEASEVVSKSLARVVAKAALIQDQMENVEQLLSLGSLADQLAPLFFQLIHECCVRRLCNIMLQLFNLRSINCL